MRFFKKKSPNPPVANPPLNSVVSQKHEVVQETVYRRTYWCDYCLDFVPVEMDRLCDHMNGNVSCLGSNLVTNLDSI